MITLPAPKQDILARRDAILADLGRLLPADAVIGETIRMKPYETDGLAAYRQMPLAVVLPRTTQEVAQVLGLAPDEVNFDFKADPQGEGLLTRLHWAGCDQVHILALRDAVRTAGWQLHSVEPAWNAAHRAVCHLKGGLDSLLTQAPQDWQFDLTLDEYLGQWQGFGGAHAESDLLLRQALQSAAGPRLVASGLALKAWLR